MNNCPPDPMAKCAQASPFPSFRPAGSIRAAPPQIPSEISEQRATVRAKPVEALAFTGNALRQAQDERGDSGFPLSSASFLTRLFGVLGLLCLWALLAEPALAQAAPASGGLPAFTATPGPGNSTTYTLSIQTLLTLTILSFLPALLLMMTSFTRIIIVFSLLRHALGTQTAPPAQVMVGLALFLTFFIMAPVADRVYDEAYLPLSENRINVMEAGERAAVPMRAFMLKQTREADLALFARLANIEKINSPEETPMRVVIPAFVTSELKTAFQIGFVVFIPFLVIDMVVASLLMSMGMMMMSPVMVSLPFKIMLFVLADGWQLLIASLVRSFDI